MNVVVPHGFEPNYSAGFVLGLQANGVRCVVVSSDEDSGLFSARGVEQVNLRGSVTEHRPSAVKAWNLARYYLRLLSYLMRHRGHTLHFTGMFRNELVLLEGLVLPVMFRLLAKRYVYTAHNVLPHDRSGNTLYRLVYRWIYRFPDTIVVHTKLAGEQLSAQFGVPSKKIVVSSIGFNDEVPSTGLSGAGARKTLGVSESEKILLFFGRIAPYKGLDLLIDAFERLDLPDTRLVVAGAFADPVYRGEIVTRLRASPSRARIDLHERHVPNEEIEVFFKAADLLVLPYRNIYQSGLIFLAMRFGLPVVATGVGSMREYVGPEMGVVTDRNDAEGVALGIRHFFEAPGRFDRQVITDRGATYRWEHVCRDLVDLYE